MMADQAEALAADVRANTAAVQDLTKATGRNRRAIRWAIAGLLGDLVLTVAGSYAYVRLVVEERESEELRAEVLCPLYGLLLDSDTPERRAQLEGVELERFEHAMTVLHKAAGRLDCS